MVIAVHVAAAVVVVGVGVVGVVANVANVEVDAEGCFEVELDAGIQNTEIWN